MRSSKPTPERLFAHSMGCLIVMLILLAMVAGLLALLGGPLTD